MLPVGIFRDAPLETIRDIAARLDLHAVQLHGHEDGDYIRTLRRQLRDCEIWTALSVGRQALTARGGDRLLFDNGSGGPGQTFDWRLAKNPRALSRALVAGGPGPANAPGARGGGALAIGGGSPGGTLPGVKA